MEITKQQEHALETAQMCIFEHEWSDFNGVKLTKLIWKAFNLGRKYELENFQVTASALKLPHEKRDK